MTERSRFWNGTVTGDASEAPYDAPTEFAAVMRSIGWGQTLAADLGGVFVDDLNRLAVSGAATPVSIATGRALVHGTWYENDAALNVAVPTPALLTRVDRIVLRKDWTTQTIRAARVAGVEGGSAPALTQVAGTTWEISLAQISTTTLGVITVTDERRLLGPIFTVRKTAAQTINNQATLTNNPDNHLFFWLGANETVEFDILLFISAFAAAADIQHNFAVPAGCAGTRVSWLYGSNALQEIADWLASLTTAMPNISASSAVDHVLFIKGIMRNGATPGEVRLRWAQNVATVADLTVAVDSHMTIRRTVR